LLTKYEITRIMQSKQSDSGWHYVPVGGRFRPNGPHGYTACQPVTRDNEVVNSTGREGKARGLCAGFPYTECGRNLNVFVRHNVSY
jgi:hypothetical protein